jgi:spermidine/putrescine transport system substrate-binding protein
MSRRALLMTAGLLGVGGVAAGCGLAPVQSSPGQGGDRSGRERYLNLSLYPHYIDGAPDGPFVTLDRFRAESGMKVQLYQDITNVTSYIQTLAARFEVGLPASTDVMIMPDQLLYRFNRAGWLQALDPVKMAPAYHAMDPVLYNTKSDRFRRHSIPWNAGATAIAYDSQVIPGGVASFEQLLTDPELKGRVGIFVDMLDSLPSIACGYGTTAAEMAQGPVQQALVAVAKAARGGQFARAYDVVGYSEAFRSGQVVAGLAYSGEILKLRRTRPGIRFAVPESGSELWINSLVVPKGSPHRANAEALMNFYYRPENAAPLAEYLECMCPVPGAQAVMARTNPVTASSRLVFPTPEDLENLTILRLLRTDELRTWGAAWTAALAGVPR